MPDETLKLMMAGAIRTLFDPIGLVTNSTMELANWDAKSSVSSSNPSTGDEDPQTPTTSTSTNLLSQALEKLTIPKPKIKWNLWRVVNSSFSECHCVDLVTYSQPSSNVMKVLKQLPPSKSRPGWSICYHLHQTNILM
jgi:hypothetical protein